MKECVYYKIDKVRRHLFCFLQHFRCRWVYKRLINLIWVTSITSHFTKFNLYLQPFIYKDAINRDSTQL